MIGGVEAHRRTAYDMFVGKVGEKEATTPSDARKNGGEEPGSSPLGGRLRLFGFVGALTSYSLVAFTLAIDAGPESSASWLVEIVTLLCTSAVASIVLVVTTRINLVILVFACKYLLILGLLYPVSAPIGIELLLLVPLAIELTVHMPMGAALPSGIGAIVLYDLFYVFVKSPSRITPTVHNTELVGLTLVVSFVVVAIWLSRFYIVRHATLDLQAERLRTIISDLTEKNLAFQEHANTVEAISAENERLKITRDLHDNIGFDLTNLSMLLQAAHGLSLKASRDLQNMLEEASVLTRDCIRQTRTTLKSLRFVEQQPASWFHRIHRLTRKFETITRTTVKVQYTNTPVSLPNEVDEALYHVIQEGLTNTLKHGHATEVEIIIANVSDVLAVCISDNGMPNGTTGEGIGLQGMKERVSPLGGSIETAALKSGFRLTVQLPLHKTVSERAQ